MSEKVIVDGETIFEEKKGVEPIFEEEELALSNEEPVFEEEDQQQAIMALWSLAKRNRDQQTHQGQQIESLYKSMAQVRKEVGALKKGKDTTSQESQRGFPTLDEPEPRAPASLKKKLAVAFIAVVVLISGLWWFGSDNNSYYGAPPPPPPSISWR